MIAPARAAAYRTLVAISSGQTDLPTGIARARRGLPLEADRALAADIATGVQRWRATLDHLIGAFSHRRIDRLDSEVVEILRISLYELLHHTRVPASAVVDDAVQLTRTIRKTSATGFVNAVLRAVSRRRQSLPLPPRPLDASDREAVLAYLTVSLSHPRWLAVRWLERVGFEAAEAWMQFNNTPAPVTLRANPLKVEAKALRARLAEEGIGVRPGRFARDALIVESGHPLAAGMARDGWFVVQDEASQLIAPLAGPDPGRRVLDTCASPGGKTLALASAMGNSGLLVASDVREKRIELLRRTLAPSGALQVRLVQMDLRQQLPFRAPFDCVLVDAPCSGLGTLRRDPDIKWRRMETDLVVLSTAQLEMVQRAGDAVRPGGRLIYSTCSSEPEENEAVARAFLESRPDFIAVHAGQAVPELPAVVIDEQGFLHTRPDRHGLEGFFGAVFKRVR